MKKFLRNLLGLVLTTSLVLTSTPIYSSAGDDDDIEMTDERQKWLDENSQAEDTSEDDAVSEEDIVFGGNGITADYVQPEYYTTSSQTFMAGNLSFYVTYTNNVPYDGKKHVATNNTSKSKALQKDISITTTGSFSSYATVTYSFKNNTSVKDASAKKAPSFTIKLKAKKNATKAQKKLIKAANKALKKHPLTFTISPLDVSDLEPTIKWSKDNSKIKSISLSFHGKTLKPGKKDYEIKLNKDGVIIVKFTNKFYGYYSNDPYYATNYMNVIFHTNCDQEVEAIRVKKGSKISVPELTRENYALASWYMNEAMTPDKEFDVENDVVTRDMDLYARWKKIVPDVLTLESSRKVALTGSSSSTTVVMHLYTDAEPDSIDLYNGTSKVATLKDDGQFSTSHDDLMGDGIYSCIVKGISTTGDISFHAECAGKQSNAVSIKYVAPFTSNELEQMNTVNESIEEFVATESFQTNTIAENLAAATTLLTNFADDGLIDINSLTQSDDGTLLLFKYTSGVNGAVPLTTIYESLIEVSATNDDASPEILGATDDTSYFKGKALILNAFPAFETDTSKKEMRTTFYKNLQSTWNSKGVSTTLIVGDDVTVDTFKTFSQYDVVDIATHGSTYKSSPAICLHESATKANNSKYSLELKNNEIVQISGRYWILPEFFNQEYEDHSLSSTFVFSESCQFLGHGHGGRTAEYNYSFTDALTSKGCPAVVGDHNSVFAVYIRDFMALYYSKLFSGSTAGEAYDAAITEYGENHKIWFEKTHTQTLQQYKESIKPSTYVYVEDEEVAWPILCGDRDSALISRGLKNGDFEQSYKSDYVSRPTFWNYAGDARSESKIGDSIPTNTLSKLCAVISTGIGSQSTTKINDGTEGSYISQTIFVPADASKLSFTYNLISEEPMEWVGSMYDDSFGLMLDQGTTNVYNEIYESINESTWYPIGNVDFAGGDHTAYQTGWLTKSVDISAYRGQILTITFVIYDKGDTIYDSACMIDDVVLE